MRGLLVMAGVILCGLHGTILLAHRAASLTVIQGCVMGLLAVAGVGWVVLPLTGAMATSLIALVMTSWAWAVTASPLVGFDATAVILLMVVGSLQQRRRRRRIQRVKQKLDDFGDEFSLKEQAYRFNQQAREVLTRKLARYQRLQTIAEQLSRLVHLEAIAQLAVSQAFELIGKSDACLLFLVDPDRQELALYASEKAQGVPAIRTKQGDQFDRYVLRTQRPLLVSDVHRDFRFGDVGPGDRPVRSVIACPVRVAQHAEGVLRLDSREAGVYTQDDLRFLDILLDLADTAVANARLFAQTQQLALTDGLTTLYRRQPFLDQLTREVARAQRTREPLVVLMLDIDDFKRYNDTFGHPAGDLVLKTVADLVHSSLPPDGMCARYGGEEFSLFLPKFSREQGTTLANQIRQVVETSGGATGHGAAQAVTVSLGLAVFPDDAKSDLELIRRADQRLYAAKRAGKNRVCGS